MTTNTGYLLSNGNDISTLFKQIVGGTTGTGLLMSNGADIGTIFEAGTNTIKTGYNNKQNVDIGTLFLSKTFTFTFTLTKTYASKTAFGLTTANNGIGYISFNVTTAGYSSVDKTTDSGANWSAKAVSNITGRAIAVNANDSVVIQANNTNIMYSTNGGTSWTGELNVATPFSCFLPRIGNTLVCSPYSQTAVYVSANPYTSYTTNTITGNNYIFSNMCSMSDSNYIYVKAGGTPVVYRNSINGNLFSSLTNITTSVPLGGETNSLFSVCCNADNSVNLISNYASGGSIFRSTAWDGAFTKVANTNVGQYIAISTSSAGNIVCACTQTKIYISVDKGQTFAQATHPSMTGIRYASVSPDEKFITVLDIPATTTDTRVYTCII